MKHLARAASATALMLAAVACSESTKAPPAEVPSDPVATAMNNEWITVAGTVQSVVGSRFLLDYGANTITVEMDDYDWYSANPLLVGDEVIVSGRIDDDFLEARTIEAASVYVEKLNEHFYASSADEEDRYRYFYVSAYPAVPTWVSLTGKVSDILREGMTLTVGPLEYHVDTSDLGYDPFDNQGAEQIDVGERVVVYGTMEDSDLFDNRRIEAAAISTISEAS